MVLTSAFTSIALLLAVVLEGSGAIQCYQCLGLQCKLQPQNKTMCNPLLKSCFQGHVVLNGVKVFGRTCALQIGPACVDTTCKLASQYVPQLRGISNCTGSCCGDDLCNKNGAVTTTPTMSTGAPSNQSTPSTAPNTTSPTEQSTASVEVTPKVNQKETPTTETSTAHAPSGKSIFLIIVLCLVLIVA